MAKSFCFSFSSFTTNPSSSTFTFFTSSGLNLNSSNSPSVFVILIPCTCCIASLFKIVVIKHNLIFSSDISFEIINTFFWCTKAVWAAISIVNLLFPALDGIANAIVSPFRIPLNTLVKIGNGKGSPLVKLFSPNCKKVVNPSFNTALLNFSVSFTWITAFSTSSTDILSYNW